MDMDFSSASIAGLSELTQCTDQIAHTRKEMAGCFNQAGARLGKAVTLDDSSQAYDMLADDLTPILERYLAQARNYMSLLKEMDQEIQAKLKVIGAASPEKRRSGDAAMYLGKIRLLARVSLQDISLSEMVSNRADSLCKAKSVKLNKALEQLRSIVSVLSDGQAIFENWLKS